MLVIENIDIELIMIEKDIPKQRFDPISYDVQSMSSNIKLILPFLLHFLSLSGNHSAIGVQYN